MQRSDEHPDAVISRLATIRDGLVTVGDALDAGVTRHEFHARHRRGMLHRAFRGVYRVGVAGLDRRTLRQAALLRLGSGGAAISHGAAEVHGLLPPILSWLHVAVPEGRRRLRLEPELPMFDGSRPIVLARQAARLADDLVDVGGEPATSVARTLIDLAGASPQRFDQAWREAGYLKVLEVGAIEAALSAGRWPGKRVVVAKLLAHREIVRPSQRFDSPIEFEAIQIVLRAGAPEPLANHWIQTRVMRRRADLYFAHALLVIEIDGWDGHSSPESFADDRARDREFLELGVLTMRFTASQMLTEPEACAEQILRQLAVRGGGPGT